MAEFLEKEIDYTELLQSFFSEQMSDGPVEIKYELEREVVYHESRNVFVYKVYHSGMQCLAIQIINRKIIVKAIDKCSNPPTAESTSTRTLVIGTGSHILSLLINLSKTLGFSLIIEVDTSALYIQGIKFSLAGLYLLTTGKSWYNSNGFYETQYEENKRITDEFINTNLSNRTDLHKFLYPDKSNKSPHTIRETFTTIYIQLKTAGKTLLHIPNEILEIYEKQLNKFYTDLLKRLQFKINGLEYHDIEPGLEHEVSASTSAEPIKVSKPPGKQSSKESGGRKRRKTRKQKL